MTTLQRYAYYESQNKPEIFISQMDAQSIDTIILTEGKFSPFKKEEYGYLLANGVKLIVDKNLTE